MPPLSIKPNLCLEWKPTTQSVLFCGTYISITELARATGLDRSYLSRIFSGKRTPSVKSAGVLAIALGMTLEAFLRGLNQEAEIDAINAHYAALLKSA